MRPLIRLAANTHTERISLYSPAHLADTSESHPYSVPRALPVRDIPARSLAASMAGQSQGHGNGSRQVARSRSCR